MSSNISKGSSLSAHTVREPYSVMSRSNPPADVPDDRSRCVRPDSFRDRIEKEVEALRRDVGALHTLFRSEPFL